MLSRPRSHEPIPWRHGVVSTPLFTAATVYAGSLTLGLAQDAGASLPLGWIGIGSLTGIAAAAVSRWVRTSGQGRRRRWFHTGFTTAWTTATAAWLNWTAHGTPWTLASAAALTATTAALTPFYAIDRGLRADEIAAQWAAESGAKTADLAAWEQHLADAGARGVQVSKQQPTRGGYKLLLTLTSSTAAHLRTLLPTLEVRAGLRTGALRLEATPQANEAWLHVTTRDVLAETIPLPADDHPLTIRKPLTLGDLESGEPLEILFRQNSVMVAGAKGSGKSVLLHVIIAALTRCVDAVIWMVDMAQGNTAKRWLRPWAQQWKDREGRLIDRPILDWVATTPDEAVRLYQAAHAVGDGRALRMKGGKIQPKESEPAIIVISDENSDLMAWTPEANKAKVRGVKKGRKAAIDYIDAVQRGTGPNTGGGEIASQYDTVIGMKFREKAEGQFVFPDHYQQVNVATLPGNGSLYILDGARAAVGGTGPERAKAYFANDEDETEDGAPCHDIEQLAVARWDIRPDLDKAAQADAAPFGYADRWTDPNRVAWLCESLDMPRPAGATTPTQQAAAHDRPPSRDTGAGLGTLTPMKPLDYYVEKAKNQPTEQSPEPAEAAGTPEMPGSGGGEGPDDPQTAAAIARALAEFERITEQAATRPEMHNKALDGAQDAQQAALMILIAAGPDGTGASAIARELQADFGTTRQTVVGWLKDWVEAGEAVRLGSGTKTRYVHRRHAPRDGAA
ncbi:hypothetical protein [Streptomyces albus]|uniref:hypothetical protein n=1 Tax=Streptomyces albus TaxID=1888 RepID=UPI0006E3079F|nr:hypothetical protein [Streptomyces albus]